MAFWERWRSGRSDDETPNANPPSSVGANQSGYNPGPPNMVEWRGEHRSAQPFGVLQPSAWSGYPEEWSTPGFNGGGGGSDWSSQIGMHKLVDAAWAAIDLNASVLATFPVYHLKNGQILPPPMYLTNPDPLVYNSWEEFAKQLFWDYQLGEAFVLPMNTDGRYPTQFRVVPPWLMNVELRNGTRFYSLGGRDVSDEVLHIRNISNTADARGHSPLEAGGARMVTASLLERYARKIAETGGTPMYWMEVARGLDEAEAADLLDRWVESRRRRAGEPALVSGGASLHQATTMSARDLTLLELSQFSEARIAVLCGVPPFLIGLPMAQGESITYSNAGTLFDFHERASLGPKSTFVMKAMSGWLLPAGRSVEQNRRQYSEPDMLSRAQAYSFYFNMVDPATGQRVLNADEIRAMERFEGVSGVAAPSLTGAEIAGGGTPPPPISNNGSPNGRPSQYGTSGGYKP